MLKSLKKWWKYLGAKLNLSFEEKADPKVQLEQAITEAQDQHRRLKEHAANVIAQQKQTEMQLNRSLEQLEKLNGNVAVTSQRGKGTRFTIKGAVNAQGVLNATASTGAVFTGNLISPREGNGTWVMPSGAQGSWTPSLTPTSSSPA